MAMTIQKCPRVISTLTPQKESQWKQRRWAQDENHYRGNLQLHNQLDRSEATDGFELHLSFHTFITKWMMAFTQLSKHRRNVFSRRCTEFDMTLNICIKKTALDKVINCRLPVKWMLSNLPLRIVPINYIFLVKILPSSSLLIQICRLIQCWFLVCYSIFSAFSL